MPKSNGTKNRDFSKFDNMSTETLENILRADSQLPNGEDSDTDAILYIMEVIAKREREKPTGKFTDVDTAWASFKENYLPYVADDKSLFEYEEVKNIGINSTTSVHSSRSPNKRRLIRVASLAAVITVVMLAGTITASALGFDLWGAVAQWTKDTFGFSSTVHDTQESYEPNNDSSNESLQEVLDNYGITAKTVPTWFPDGFSFESLNVSETPAKTIIYAQYSNMSNAKISINIMVLS